jgi:zinc protease
MLAYIERAYKEKDKTESDQLADEYIRNFLTDEPIPGIEFEYKLYNELLPELSWKKLMHLLRNGLQTIIWLWLLAPLKKRD